MLDAQYFTDHLPAELIRMEASASVVIHLTDGRRYDVRQIQAALPGYVLVEVFPPEGKSIEIDRSTPGSPRLANGDRVAISYDAITTVVLTREHPRSSMGFQAAAEA